jgi:multisubunit Na+/H+ antiporter MnhG subunit
MNYATYTNKVVRLIKQLSARQAVVFIGLVIIDAAFFSSVNPTNAASLLLVLGFVLSVATFYGLCRVVCKLLSLYSRAIRAQQKQLVAVLSVIFGLSLALTSIGQFSPRDLLVIIPIAIIAYVYLLYSRGRQTKRSS